MTDAFTFIAADTESRDPRQQALAEIERVVALNAKGMIARTYEVMTDRVVWVYGPYACPQSDEMETHFGLCKGDDKIDWPQFKAWMISKMRKAKEEASQSHWPAQWSPQEIEKMKPGAALVFNQTGFSKQQLDAMHRAKTAAYAQALKQQDLAQAQSYNNLAQLQCSPKS